MKSNISLWPMFFGISKYCSLDFYQQICELSLLAFLHESPLTCQFEGSNYIFSTESFEFDCFWPIEQTYVGTGS